MANYRKPLESQGHSRTEREHVDALLDVGLIETLPAIRS
jgi:hypothetical protein